MAEIAQEITDLFNEGLSKGLDRKAIVKMFILDGDLEVDEAIRTYNVLARDAGITLSNDEKKDRQKAVLEEADLTSEEGVEEAVDALCKAIDIAPSTAMDRIRKYAKENDIDLPGGERGGQIASRESVVQFLIANDGADRKVLIDGLVAMGYKKATALSFLAVVPYMKEYAAQMGFKQAA